MKRTMLFLVTFAITITAALADDVQYDIRVDGITCPFCVATSERALKTAMVILCAADLILSMIH